MRFWEKSLRARLTTYFILFLLISGVILGALVYWQSRVVLQEDVLKRLETAASLKENEINRWLVEKTQEVRLLSKTPVVKSSAEALLTLDKSDPAVSKAYRSLSSYLIDVLAASPDWLEVWLLDRRGEVIFSTYQAQEGTFHVTDTFFIEGQKDTFTQNVYFLPALNRTAITVATPLDDGAGQALGVLAVHFNLDRLDQIILERAGLGQTGETYLVDSLNVFISQAGVDPAAFPRGVHTEGIDRALAGQSGHGLYLNYRGTPVFGVYRWLPDHNMALLAEIAQSEALAPVSRFGINIGLITLLVIGFGSLAGYVSARQISRPVVAIAQTADQVARGDLKQRAPIMTTDEIGGLAQTFNQMAVHLEELYASLEERIAARTRRLETVAILSERLSAILDLKQLLAALVQQVKDSFGYYHVLVYLLDETGQNLGLVVAAGKMGQPMTAEGHTVALAASTSLIARAARTGQIVAASDVQQVPDWQAHPLLSDTRSEMAVPIILASQVAGVLDVQEARLAGLDEGDAALLRSLANQVAVAIRNARLFEQVETALVEARAAQARYLQQAWQPADAARQFSYDQQQPGEAALTLAELAQLHQAAAAQLQPTILHPTGQVTGQAGNGTMPFTALVAPIKLQDQVIGTMEFHDTNPARPRTWTEPELALVQAITDQVAQMAENLRLFDETRRQAGYERMVGEITQKIRQAPNIEILVQTAAETLNELLGAAGGEVQLNFNPQTKGGNGHDR